MTLMAIDLYCGLGGWAEGFLAEGYRVIGFDIERHDYGTGGYPSQLVLQDVTTLHGSQFKDATCIVASPPCQAYSYRAMPWSRAKALPPPDNTLFDACFRIQREASEAAGRYIPLVIENVRGAQKWVGRAKWHFGSYYLWGDVPALMPITLPPRKFGDCKEQIWNDRPVGNVAAHREGSKSEANSNKRLPGAKGGRISGWPHNDEAVKVPSESGRRTDVGKGARFTSRDCGPEAVKVSGVNFSDRNSPGFNVTAAQRFREEFQVGEGGVKGFTPHGEPLEKNTLGRRFGSKSNSRKAASAMIAKIPFPLANHIAKVFASHVQTDGG